MPQNPLRFEKSHFSQFPLVALSQYIVDQICHHPLSVFLLKIFSRGYFLLKNPTGSGPLFPRSNVACKVRAIIVFSLPFLEDHIFT